MSQHNFPVLKSYLELVQLIVVLQKVHFILFNSLLFKMSPIIIVTCVICFLNKEKSIKFFFSRAAFGLSGEGCKGEQQRLFQVRGVKVIK